MMAPLRWGIWGTGLIAHDFATALLTNPVDHVIAAIGGRDARKVKDFAENFGIANQFADIQGLSGCGEVDVVYICTLTSLHYAHTKYFLEAGKNVVCEKPLTLNNEQARELIELAKSRGRFLMVGMWSRFFPASQRLREAIDSGKLGRIRVLQANFCVPKAASVLRLNRLELGGGALADFGVYLVNLACWVFKGERPEKIVALGDLFDSGADRAGSMVLKYKDGAVASLTFSMDCGIQTEAIVMGEAGTAKLGDIFWCPTKLKINDETFEQAAPTYEGREFTFWNSGGLVYEANHVKECLDKGLTESPVLPNSDCQLMHDILQEGYNQLGVDYSGVC